MTKKNTNVEFLSNNNINKLSKRKYDNRAYKIDSIKFIKDIIKNNYIINSNIEIFTKTTIIDIIPILKERFTIYKSPNSNKQFSLIYNSDLYFRNKLMEMFVN